LARSEAAQLTAEHVIAQAAEERAAATRKQAERAIETIRSEADDYAFDVLCKLEQELKRALTVIENGIRTIQADQGTGGNRSPIEGGHEADGGGEKP
jgi:hypothetical protein